MCMVWRTEDGACVLVASPLVFYAIVSRSMLDDFFPFERRVKASTVRRYADTSHPHIARSPPLAVFHVR